MKYYLSSSGHETGPYDKNELIDSYKYGALPGDAMVSGEGSDTWFPVSDFVEAPPVSGIVSAPQTPFTQLQETTSAPVRIDGNYHRMKSPGIAILLEIIPGVFFQTFGLGNIYAGNLTSGLVLMLTYWSLAILNFFLLFILLGFITWPITFVIYLVLAIIFAQKSTDRSNWRVIMEGKKSAKFNRV
ncbi:MAG: DUF4339 domain-containing protein [Verrucomicrobiales bacterium]|nr:DUF4339 domain-containing protein [Verrucomicrobiales bacterium]